MGGRPSHLGFGIMVGGRAEGGASDPGGGRAKGKASDPGGGRASWGRKRPHLKCGHGLRVGEMESGQKTRKGRSGGPAWGGVGGGVVNF